MKKFTIFILIVSFLLAFLVFCLFAVNKYNLAVIATYCYSAASIVGITSVATNWKDKNN